VREGLAMWLRALTKGVVVWPRSLAKGLRLWVHTLVKELVLSDSCVHWQHVVETCSCQGVTAPSGNQDKSH
jgi:hypothetical protein